MLLRNLLFFASLMACHISAFSAPQPICSDARFIRLRKVQGDAKLSIIRILGLFIASSFFAAHATAAIILSQSPPSTSTRTSDSNATFSLNQQAQSITLAQNTAVAAVVVWGAYNSSATPTDNFTISFYNDAAGLPQEPSFQTDSITPAFREATSLTTITGETVFKYIFNLPAPVILNGGTTYYMSVLNNTSEVTAWAWSEIVPKGGPRWNKVASGTSWNFRRDSLAFELSNNQINPVTVGGTITGLAFNNLVVLQNNGGDNLAIAERFDVPGGTGPFRFSAPLVSGDTYSVSVFQDSAGQTCSVTNGSGAIGSNDITSVQVDCVNTPYTIGGQVTGLVSGDTLVLQNNAGDDLTLASDGAFTFSTPVPYTNAYSVTVLTQPSAPSETCTVTNGVGTVPGSNVNNVSVTCSINTFTVGGSVSGLTSGGSIELQNNGADSQILTADGAFIFAAQADGTGYNVSVATQPVGQTCSVTSGMGTLAGADVGGISVSCVDNSYTIGGSLSGLVAGDSVVLQNNAGDNLTLMANGAFNFATPVDFGDPYSASVLSQPTGPTETCTIANASGTTPAGNINNIVITCAVNSIQIGGAVSGLASGNNLTLQLNGADDQVLTGNGSFSFTPIADGSTYSVTVSSQPTGQTCSVASGSGTLAGSAVTNVAVSCLDNQYTVGGLLSGLVAGDTVVLQNNSGDALTLAADGAFTFATAVDFGDVYAALVSSQPSQPSEACSVTNGSGTIPASNVTNVSVICALNSFAVGGSVSGLATGETVVLQNSGADDQTLSADGNFVFSQQADGSSYSVAVSTQPVGQTCIVADGGGTLSGADVSSVSVSCVDTPAPTPTATPVPTMSAYGLGITAIGLFLLSAAEIRRKRAQS